MGGGDVEDYIGKGVAGEHCRLGSARPSFRAGVRKSCANARTYASKTSGFTCSGAESLQESTASESSDVLPNAGAPIDQVVGPEPALWVEPCKYSVLKLKHWTLPEST